MVGIKNENYSIQFTHLKIINFKIHQFQTGNIIYNNQSKLTLNICHKYKILSEFFNVLQ